MAVNVFGRLAAPKDARDFRFLMRSAMPQVAAAIGKPKPRVRAYNVGPMLDQGSTPQCVGYSTRSFLDAAPLMSKANVGPSATEIYKTAQSLDEWPGTNYDGTSVRAGMKALEAAKQISGYVWAQSIDEAINWMNGGYGTVVVGTNWYAEMSDVDNDQFMREPPPSMATPIGGHAWHVIWFDVKKKGFLMKQSWGNQFGWLTKAGTLSGFAYVRKEFMERLLREDGEIGSPTQIKVKPVQIF